MKTALCSVLVLLAAVATAPVHADDADRVQLPPKERFHLFLLVGQSNMAGRGKVAPQDEKAHPRVLVFNEQRQWVPATDPLHFDKPGIVGVGLGKTFGETIAEANPNVTIGLIPCAVGGSPIDSWQPGGYHAQTKSHPYDDTLKRAHAALEHGTLRAILWHQGESDSQPGKAKVYESKLHALIQRFRSELEAPEVPFVAGQMGQFQERPWSDIENCPKKFATRLLFPRMIWDTRGTQFILMPSRIANWDDDTPRPTGSSNGRRTRPRSADRPPPRYPDRRATGRKCSYDSPTLRTRGFSCRRHRLSTLCH